LFADTAASIFTQCMTAVVNNSVTSDGMHCSHVAVAGDGRRLKVCRLAYSAVDYKVVCRRAFTSDLSHAELYIV